MHTPEGYKRWQYSGTADPQRLTALTTGLPLRELIAQLKGESSFLCFHTEPKDGDPSYRRAVFCFVLTKTLFDLFFNAQTGYRGAYFDSPDSGLRVNRSIIDELSPILLQWGTTQAPGERRAWIAESLSLSSAKIWLAEDPGLCSKCRGEWSQSYKSPLTIVNGRWEIAEHTHAEWGRQAPELTKLRVFGGFVNTEHQEWVASHKTIRGLHIWKHGWS